MQGIVAVEKNLAKLSTALEIEGYEVILLEPEPLDQDVDVIVVSGIENPNLYFSDELVDVPIIHAAGKTTQEILAELEKL